MYVRANKSSRGWMYGWVPEKGEDAVTGKREQKPNQRYQD